MSIAPSASIEGAGGVFRPLRRLKDGFLFNNRTKHKYNEKKNSSISWNRR
jgi:hypothetical protein